MLGGLSVWGSLLAAIGVGNILPRVAFLRRSSQIPLVLPFLRHRVHPIGSLSHPFLDHLKTSIRIATTWPSYNKTQISQSPPQYSAKHTPISSPKTRPFHATRLKMAEETKKKILRTDYKPSAYRISHVDLAFDLDSTATHVHSDLRVERVREGEDLKLDGEDLELVSVSVNGVPVENYKKNENFLLISHHLLSNVSTIQTHVKINPSSNLQLMGLYKSGGLFCTQCEAEGFRRITYFLDRPDVMSTFKVTMRGLAKECPVMLCNGNKMEESIEGDKKKITFCDPHPKPAYLFAIVAGDLGSIQSHYLTKSGRKVHLEIFSEPAEVSKLEWAMESIKMAMKWDEDAFGREYDLDNFYIVCVADFNMGAMENKGLNIFNTALLLANGKTTTDAEYKRILNVVGHEYFHNWTGNRVTCRDWFQLTLKEGLTVYRDQEFIRDLSSPASKRIEDISFLKNRQFSEDAGPMSHPIRPESYLSMDNFYTATVYDKGAEVVRMYETIFGKEGFRAGMDLYFKRHDGQAVTCEDFFAALHDANKSHPRAPHFPQFLRWYFQSGTPEVEVVGLEYVGGSLSVSLRQSRVDNALLIPVRLGLIGKNSKKELLGGTETDSEGRAVEKNSVVLMMKEMEETFVLKNLTEEPICSFFRDFSAPVKFTFKNETDENLAFLMAHDSDPINKWTAAQTLYKKYILQRAQLFRGLSWKESLKLNVCLPDSLRERFAEVLRVERPDAEKYVEMAYALSLPEEDAMYLDMAKPVDYVAIHYAAKSIRKELYEAARKDVDSLFVQLGQKDDCDYSRTDIQYVGSTHCMDLNHVARRKLRNVLLSFIASDPSNADLVINTYQQAQCMTDKLAAFRHIVNLPQNTQHLQSFYQQAKGDALMLDKWFSMQALSEREDCLEQTERLASHADFSMTNPNRMRSLVFAFCRNSPQLHRADGKGYEFLKKIIIELDAFNPQMSSRAATFLTMWEQTDPARQKHIIAVLKEINAKTPISLDLKEILHKTLQNAH